VIGLFEPRHYVALIGYAPGPRVPLIIFQAVVRGDPQPSWHAFVVEATHVNIGVVCL
jgi:hypothetical protein